MPVTNKGWELHVTRLGLHLSGAKKRTYGQYRVLIDGIPQDDLHGFMVERIGPGDNGTPNNGKRIEAARSPYALWTQFGTYRSIGYSTDTSVAGKPPMPAILLSGTGHRTGILIHPAHPPKLYLSSVGCLNPTNPLLPNENVNFWDSRARVLALLASLKAYDSKAFQHETMTRIDNAQVVIDGEPMEVLTVPPVAALTFDEPESLPISAAAARDCAQWLNQNFGAKMHAATNGKAYSVKHLCAIVCQETAYKWLKWTATMDPQTIIERCVFDASGDYPGAPRGVFPINTAAFENRFGQQLTAMLIEEANKTRRLQGWPDKTWVYKGYGIFQYDLQHILDNAESENFFRKKKWYNFDNCLNKVVSELDTKLSNTRGDLWAAIKAYNGSGTKATQYAENVKAFTRYCAEVVG